MKRHALKFLAVVALTFGAQQAMNAQPLGLSLGLRAGYALNLMGETEGEGFTDLHGEQYHLTAEYNLPFFPALSVGTEFGIQLGRDTTVHVTDSNHILGGYAQKENLSAWQVNVPIRYSLPVTWLGMRWFAGVSGQFSRAEYLLELPDRTTKVNNGFQTLVVPLTGGTVTATGDAFAVGALAGFDAPISPSLRWGVETRFYHFLNSPLKWDHTGLSTDFFRETFELGLNVKYML